MRIPLPGRAHQQRRCHRQKRLDRAQSSRALTGLLSCRQVLPRDSEPCRGRYVAGQDDGRNSHWKVRAQFRRVRDRSCLAGGCSRQGSGQDTRMPPATRASTSVPSTPAWCDDLRRQAGGRSGRSRRGRPRSPELSRSDACRACVRRPSGPIGGRNRVCLGPAQARPRLRTPNPCPDASAR